MGSLKVQLICVALGDPTPPSLRSLNHAEYDGCGKLRCCLDIQTIHWDKCQHRTLEIMSKDCRFSIQRVSLLIFETHQIREDRQNDEQYGIGDEAQVSGGPVHFREASRVLIASHFAVDPGPNVV